MSDVQHKIFVGAPTVIDIDGNLIIPLLPPFRSDSSLIKADSTSRRADETV